jgi:ABC-type transport system involved in multi-copper enzyme maturation permease subunit
MKNLSVALWAEIMKSRKSSIFPGTIIFFIFVSFMMALIMFVQKYPDISGKLGMIGDKATMLRFGEPDWTNYFRLITEGLGAIGLIGVGFVTSWVFGREFSDHTLKDILSLPVSRSAIVLSKFIVVTIWFAILIFAYLATALLAGKIIGLPGFSIPLIQSDSETFLITALLISFLSTPVAFFASLSKGYILPIGFVILTLILANFSGIIGLGPYFPWAIPGLYGVHVSEAGMQLKPLSYIILFLTSIIGFAGTILIWRFGDHK